MGFCNLGFPRTKFSCFSENRRKRRGLRPSCILKCIRGSKQRVFQHPVRADRRPLSGRGRGVGGLSPCWARVDNTNPPCRWRELRQGGGCGFKRRPAIKLGGPHSKAFGLPFQWTELRASSR